MSDGDQRSGRALLIFVVLPAAIVVGTLAAAVLGSGGSDARAPAPAPRDEPAAAVAAPPGAGMPPSAVVPPAAVVPPSAVAPPSAVVPPGAGMPPPAVSAPPPLPHPPAAATSPAAPAPSRAYAPPGTERVDVGIGAQGAAIFRVPGAAARPGAVVVFLHGWVAIDPQRYGPWISHLVRGGATVIYPAYQTKPAYDTITPLANVQAGVRTALEHVQVAPGRLVVAGHSAGGALSADYAAVATANDLPAPAAVFSVYPGRKLRHLAVPIPAVNLGTIAAGTRVLTLAGERDTAVGSGTAERIVSGATQADATLRIIRDDAVDDHSAPRRFDGVARRTFWEPLDALVAATARHAATARSVVAGHVTRVDP